MSSTLTIYHMNTRTYPSDHNELVYIIVCDASGESDQSSTLRVSVTGAMSDSFSLSVNVSGSGSTLLYFGTLDTPKSGQIVISASLDGMSSTSKSISLSSTANDGGAVVAVYSNRVYSGTPFDVGISGNSTRDYELWGYTTLTASDSMNMTGTRFTIGTGLTANPSQYQINSCTVTDSQLSSLLTEPVTPSVDVLFVVVAKSGGRIVAAQPYTSRRITIFPGDGYRPTISSVSVSDLNGHKEKFGVYVERFSSVSVTVACSAKYGSEIATIEIEASDRAGDLYVRGTSATQTVGTPTVTGDRTLLITVTDLRGVAQSTSVGIQVGAYATPAITEFTALRWSVSEAEEDDSSSTVRLSLSGSLCVINGVAASGTATFRARENAEGTSFSEVGSNSLSGAFGATFLDAQSQDVETSYVYQAILTDEFGTQATIEAQVGTSRPIMDFHVGGESIGMWTAAREAAYQDGTDATGLFIDNDIILSEGRSISGSGGAETGQMVYDRLLRASYNYATESFIMDALQHLVLANGKHIAGRNASGSITRLLGINESGQTELNWTSGGLKGRVSKQIWSGTAAMGSTITVPEIVYYNTFRVWYAQTSFPIILNRQVTGATSSRIVGGGVFPNWDAAADQSMYLFAISLLPSGGSHTSINVEVATQFALASGTISPISRNNIVKIEGLL